MTSTVSRTERAAEAQAQVKAATTHISDSASDTEEDERDPIDEIRRRPFATLTPLNEAAKLNFDKAYEEVCLAQPPDQHQCQFMEGKAKVSLALPPSSFSTSDGDSDSAHLAPAPPPGIWTGCYNFSLATLPFQPTLGWMIGSAKFRDGSTTPQVDIRLWQDGKKIQYRHARLGFTESGSLYLSPRHSGVSIDAKPVSKGERTALLNSASISLGDATYRFEYAPQTGLQQAAWRKAISRHTEQIFGIRSPHPAISATPTPHNVRVGDWELRAVTVVNLKTVIKAAIRLSDSQAGAVKMKTRYTYEEAEAARKELGIYRSIGEAVHGLGHPGTGYLRRICDVIWTGGQEGWNPDRKDDMYMFFQPFGRETAGERLIRGDEESWSLESKRSFFAALLLGLDAFHTAGFIHRDVKLNNLMLENQRPERLTIIDFEQSIKTLPTLTPTLHNKWGTIGYLAPEAENTAFAPTYGPKVDVFSAAVVAYYLFIGTPPWMHKENIFLHRNSAEFLLSSIWLETPMNAVEKKLVAFKRALEEMSCGLPNSLENLLGQMLAPDPSSRISLRDALQHPWIEAEVQTLRTQNAEVGQRRPAEDDAGG